MRRIKGSISIEFDDHDSIDIVIDSSPRVGADADLLSQVFRDIGNWLQCHVPQREE